MNIATENTKREREEAFFKRRYNDSPHKEKINIKDTAFIISATLDGDKKTHSRALSILPPSKSEIGIRFRAPRSRDESAKS